MAESSSNRSSVEVPEEIRGEAFGHLVGIVAELRKFILSRNRVSTINAELELRFGALSEPDWVQLSRSLERFDRWTKVSDGWKEYTDFFYTCHKLGPVRTTRTEGKDGVLAIEHVKKTRVTFTDLSMEDCRIADSVRITLSTEEELDEKDLPVVVHETSLVRIKLRRSFTWNDWRFDLTKSWSGKTLSEASKNRKKNVDTAHEFEIEMLNPSAVLQKADHSDDYVAACIVLRILGVIPNHSCRLDVKR